MACCRKSLAIGYNYLSRRFHPSFIHLVQDDRERSGATKPFPALLASSPQLASVSPSFDKFKSSVRDWRRPGFSFPVAIHHFPRNYSAASDGSNEIGYIKDVADVLTDTTVLDTSAVATVADASTVSAPFSGEVATAAADSFLPVAALQYLIDAVHSFTGLNWWASIVMTTLLIRGATVPLLVNQMKASAKLNIMRPELEKLKEELNNNIDPKFVQEGQRRMKELFKKHGVTPFTPLKGALIQGPVFISFFFAISNMVEKVPSFKVGGAFWFTDLTTPDPMYIFPVLTSLSFLATVELNMQEGMEGNPMAKIMKNFSRVLGLLTIPFTATFPKAIFCYWVTSNLFSLAYGFALKRPPVRKFLHLPDAAAPKLEPSSLANFSFAGTSKSASPAASPIPERRVSSSSIISQRIRNLEKSVKSRSKFPKR